MVDAQTIALTCITQYPRWYSGKLQSIKHTDKIRGDLALESIEYAAKSGYAVVIVDGGSPKTFRKKVKQIEQVVLIVRKSAKRAPARRLAFLRAAKIPGVLVIVNTEAEKVGFIKESIEHVVQPVLDNTADIVIPKRKQKLFQQSYPTYQYASEVEGNALYNAQLHLHGLLKPTDEDLDIFFGPKVFRNDRKIISLFLKRFTHGLESIEGLHFDPEELSNTTLFPIVLALQKKLRVISIEVSFRYPAMQKENEEVGALEYFAEKRRWQRMGLLLELMQFLHMIKIYHHKK